MSHESPPALSEPRASLPLMILAAGGGMFALASAAAYALVLPAPDDSLVLSIIFAVLVSGLGAMGTLLASLRPRNPIGWLLLFADILFSIGVVGANYAQRSLALAGGSWPLTVLAAWMASWTFVLGIGVMGIFMPLLFPTGRLASPRWRWVVLAGAVGLAGGLAPSIFGPGPMSTAAPIDNPLGIDGAGPLLNTINGWSSVLAPIVFGLVVISLVQRYRRGGPVDRAQIKWFLYPAAVAGAGMGIGLTGIQVIGDLAWLIGLAATALLPIAIGIAILRHRLFDIDVIINRTLVYGGLTVVLAVVYVLSVLLLEQLLSPFTADSGLAVAASTLGVVALFQPLRRRMQALVDRRFYRSRYDASLVVSSFSSQLRDQVELTRLTDELGATISDALQPASVSVWLRGPSSDR
ncbi:MAG TPA: hypothetical protein VFM74_07560 [Candidatus Limnocylindria bacterium]|nr:hypothetical protein [Candidatus Limnocylindria bacterium]